MDRNAFLWFWAAAVLVLILGFLAGEISNVAENKGYPKRRYFHICFWLGPLGYLIVIALPDLKARELQQQILAALEGSVMQGDLGVQGPHKTAAEKEPSPLQNVQLPPLE